MEKRISNEELLDRIEESARNYEIQHHGCSRCVLAALQEHLGIGDEESFKASTPLGGGIAMMGDTCGALIGGLMAIGLVTASDNIEDETALVTLPHQISPAGIRESFGLDVYLNEVTSARNH